MKNDILIRHDCPCHKLSIFN